MLSVLWLVFFFLQVGVGCPGHIELVLVLVVFVVWRSRGGGGAGEVVAALDLCLFVGGAALVLPFSGRVVH